MAEKKKMGRPRKEIDYDNLAELCKLQCTLEEVAGFFHCSPDTINNWCHREHDCTFSEIYKKESQEGKISLRRAQIKTAMKGNATMLIWLGKQYLGQKEAQTITLDNDIDDDGFLDALQKGLVKRNENK